MMIRLDLTYSLHKKNEKPTKKTKQNRVENGKKKNNREKRQGEKSELSRFLMQLFDGTCGWCAWMLILDMLSGSGRCTLLELFAHRSHSEPSHSARTHQISNEPTQQRWFRIQALKSKVEKPLKMCYCCVFHQPVNSFVWFFSRLLAVGFGAAGSAAAVAFFSSFLHILMCFVGSTIQFVVCAYRYTHTYSQIHTHTNEF